MYAKSFLFLTSFILASGASSLIAQDDGCCDVRPGCKRQGSVKSSSCAPDPCTPCAQLWPSRGPNWIITPSAGPCVCRSIGFFLTTEFLYWTAREDHLGFAFTAKVTGTLPNALIGKGKVTHPDWKFNPGFRVGVGLTYDCHDGWDLYANYTWFRVWNTRKTVHAKENEVVFNFQFDPIPVAGQVEGNWELHFNVVDVELGRNFYISRCLKLRPYFSLKGTWQKQFFTIDASGFDPIALTNVFSPSRERLKYWGVGARAGLDTCWDLTQRFSFLGEVAVTALWERFNNRGRSSFTFPEAGQERTLFNISNTFHTIKPILELFLGIRWETWFCCDAFHFNFDAGWELQWWGNQNQFFDFFAETKEGDLALQGLTARFRFDF